MKILINRITLVCEILVYQRGKIHNSKSTVNPGGIYTLLEQGWCTFYPTYKRSPGGGGNKMTCSTSVQYLLYGAMDQHIIPLCKETKWNILFWIDCLKFHQPPENMISVTRLKKRNWNIVDFYRFLTASVRLIKFCSYRRLINNS